MEQNANQLLVRWNFMELSHQEQSDYIRVVEAAKNEEEKEWAIVGCEPKYEWLFHTAECIYLWLVCGAPFSCCPRGKQQ